MRVISAVFISPSVLPFPLSWYHQRIFIETFGAAKLLQNLLRDGQPPDETTLIFLITSLDRRLEAYERLAAKRRRKDVDNPLNELPTAEDEELFEQAVSYLNDAVNAILDCPARDADLESYGALNAGLVVDSD